MIMPKDTNAPYFGVVGNSEILLDWYDSVLFTSYEVLPKNGWNFQAQITSLRREPTQKKLDKAENLYGHWARPYFDAFGWDARPDQYARWLRESNIVTGYLSL